MNKTFVYSCKRCGLNKDVDSEWFKRIVGNLGSAAEEILSSAQDDKISLVKIIFPEGCLVCVGQKALKIPFTVNFYGDK